jgi:hypothetical protein
VLLFALRKSMSAHSGETERGGEIAHTLLLNTLQVSSGYQTVVDARRTTVLSQSAPLLAQGLRHCAVR